jgi:hypothetical protein
MTTEECGSGHEKRKAVRLRTLLGARAVFNGGKSTLDCQIRNISTTGAQLAIQNLAIMPDEDFLLVVPARNKTYRVEFRWRSDNAAGVRFLDEINAVGGEALISLGSSVEELRAENARLRRRIAEMSTKLAELGYL